MKLPFCLLLLCSSLSACGDRSASTEEPRASRSPGGAAQPADDAPAPGSDDPESDTDAAPALADRPTIDLLANRYRFHLGGADHLTIPLASEGLRKYTQEYSQPWGRVVRAGGRRGRVLEERAATLRFPWDGATRASARFRVHGSAPKQRLSVRLNGEPVANRDLDDGWQAVSVELEGLRRGENELVLYLGRRGRAGDERTWGLWHSIELGATGADDAPPLEPVRELSVDGDARPALGGAAGLRMYLEIPDRAHLVLDSGVREGEAKLRVVATPVGGEPVVLVDETQRQGWKRRRVSLAPLARRLVVLDLETSAPATTGWADARIALEELDLVDAPPPIENAVLVVVDALRSDRLRAYAPDTRVETPRITRETEARGAVFLYNQAASPSSPPSHGSIQTGMIPRVHGVVGDRADLDPGTPMLSTQARDADIEAAYYGNNVFGMGRLEEPGNWTAFHQPSREGKGFDCTQLIPGMLDFARRQAEAGERFVISSLPYEPHTPYRYHEGITDQYHDGPWKPPVGKRVGGDLLGALGAGNVTLDEAGWKQLRALYDGEVTYFDGCFADLLDGLDEIGVLDDTAVILTSDHGEGMFEHGKMGHAYGHYAELGDVPMIVYAPGLTDGGMTIEHVSSHLDITPTILDLLGVDIDERVQGRSLVPLIRRRGHWTPRVVSLEYGRSYALRGWRWKYIVDYSQNESVFDLENDPDEQHDLVGENPVALRYLRDLAGFFLAHRRQWRVERWGDLNNHSAAFAEAHGPD